MKRSIQLSVAVVALGTLLIGCSATTGPASTTSGAGSPTVAKTATFGRIPIGPHSPSRAESIVLASASTLMKNEVRRDPASPFAKAATAQPTIGWYLVQACAPGLLLLATFDPANGDVKPAYSSYPYVMGRLPEIPCSGVAANASQNGVAEQWATWAVSAVLGAMPVSFEELRIGVVEYVVAWRISIGTAYAVLRPNGAVTRAGIGTSGPVG